MLFFTPVIEFNTAGRRRSSVVVFALGAFTAIFGGRSSEAATLGSVSVERLSSQELRVQWSGSSPVDIFVSTAPGSSVEEAEHVATASSAGVFDFKRRLDRRPYFILRDQADGKVRRVAERNLPLERGSNFRDIGGYPTVDGRHVRWGAIYRTAAMPDLSERDHRYIRQLGIREDIDLRSSDERSVWPDKLPLETGALYISNDYKFDRTKLAYSDWLTELRPQLRQMFQALLRHDGAVIVHCSAGQDRTGIATALILFALGVPQNVIVDDYLLSAYYREPRYEVSAVDLGRFQENAYVQFIEQIGGTDPRQKPEPLYDNQGIPYLMSAFDDMSRHWGSVMTYLRGELGVGPVEVQRLRLIYLE